MCTDPAVVAVHVSAMAAEIRHVLAVGRRQGAWDAVLCALAVGAAAACCASETTQPARFVALFGGFYERKRGGPKNHLVLKLYIRAFELRC